MVLSPEVDKCARDLVISQLIPRFMKIESDKHHGSSALASAHSHDIPVEGGLQKGVTTLSSCRRVLRK